jgi:hypothetical protein
MEPHSATYFPKDLKEYYNGGPQTTAEAFPPACLRTHWDPTMVVKHVLPDFYAAGTLDPRPAAKICFAYHYSSAGDAPLPAEPRSTLPPTPPQFLGGLHAPGPTVGGAVWPPGGHAKINFPSRGYKVDVETDVQRIDEPLTKCAEKRFIPPGGVPAPRDFTDAVEGSSPPGPPEVLGGPRAGCREADDAEAWARSDRLFFNPTKYDRSTMVPPGAVRMATSRHALPYPQKPAY